MSVDVDSIVIGGGVVGLAIARALALTGREVVVLEKNDRIGEETSSRNSEVIHAGIYYPTDSLKARLCTRGKQALYEYCASKNVPHSRCGKVIVAIEESQRPRLDALRAQATANGVDDLEPLDRAAVARLEPAVSAVAGLLSPSTGIVDAHALMLAYVGDLESAGGAVAVRSEALAVSVDDDGCRVTVRDGDERNEVRAHAVINAGGLHATTVADACRGGPPFTAPRTRYAKGRYFSYSGPSPFTHLVYPLPVDGGLGIHATLDLAGALRFGPDVEWCDVIDYAMDDSRADDFHAAIRAYWPAVERGRLAPAYSGVRPKLSGPGEPAADFRIEAPLVSRAASLVHLFGIESPGLTASLAIAEHVQDLLDVR
jgi:L-2-hydroxyglutarate oxidase LhgO